MFNNKKSSFDKINDYLVKKGHELVFSIYLADYNGNNIYIRFDYVPKIAVYKIVWVDLNFLNVHVLILWDCIEDLHLIHIQCNYH